MNPAEPEYREIPTSLNPLLSWRVVIKRPALLLSRSKSGPNRAAKLSSRLR